MTDDSPTDSRSSAESDNFVAQSLDGCYYETCSEACCNFGGVHTVIPTDFRHVRRL